MGIKATSLAAQAVDWRGLRPIIAGNLLDCEGAIVRKDRIITVYFSRRDDSGIAVSIRYDRYKTRLETGIFLQ